MIAKQHRLFAGTYGERASPTRKDAIGKLIQCSEKQESLLLRLETECFGNVIHESIKNALAADYCNFCRSVVNNGTRPKVTAAVSGAV